MPYSIVHVEGRGWCLRRKQAGKRGEPVGSYKSCHDTKAKAMGASRAIMMSEHGTSPANRKTTNSDHNSRSQSGVVMREFYTGKLRSSSGEKVTSPEQAKAIAMSEQRAVQARGREERTWRGRTRMRPVRKG